MKQRIHRTGVKITPVDQIEAIRPATVSLEAAVPALLLLTSILLGGCDSLPARMPRDPQGTALNASSSSWRGVSSTGAYSLVEQVTTAENQYSFKETWCRGKGPDSVTTRGKGVYEPSTQINIYQYSDPPGIVVVRTRETKEAMETEDTVLASTIPMFKAGEKITYSLWQ